MRRLVVSLVLLGLGGALAFTLATRERSGPAPALAGSEDNDAALGGGELDAGAAEPEVTEVKKVALGRPLRVVAPGWELLVPGVIANRGIAAGQAGAFASRGLEVELAVAPRLADIEAALAAGGESKRGADVAIVPLPLLAIAYENLRALRPQLFWVIGSSRGRDALYGPEGALARPPRGGIELIGERGEAATFLALYSLDLAGAELERVKLRAPSDVADRVALAAVDRAAPGASRRAGSRAALLTTADATRLIPYVAIAPAGFLEANRDAAAAFAAGWLAGVETLRADVPAAAREVAALEDTPEPVVLIKRLGQIEFVDLAANAELLGLSGRGAVTADALFAESARIWRRAGVLTTPAPEAAPIAPGTVTTLAFGRDVGRPAAVRFAAADGAKPLLISVLPADDEKVLERVGVIAGIFSRSVLRIGVSRDRKRTAAAIEQAAERFGIDPARLVADPGLSRRKKAAIAVLPAP
jgi:hypothetical protein